MKNRITAVILLIAMMTSALVFAACGEDAGSVKPADTAAAQGGEGEEEETTLSEAEARLALPDNLPEADYQGYTFRIAGRTRDDFVQEIGAEEEDGQADERVGEADGDAGELAARHLEQEELEGDEEGEERRDGGQGLHEGLPEDVARREGLRRFDRGRAGGL